MNVWMNDEDGALLLVVIDFRAFVLRDALPRNVLSFCLISEFQGANIILMASNRVLISDQQKHNRSNIIM